MKCRICCREVGERDYCDFHAKAHDAVVRKYDAWKKALGLSWKEYLSEIAKNPVTGEWAKEVAEHLIKEGEQ